MFIQGFEVKQLTTSWCLTFVISIRVVQEVRGNKMELFPREEHPQGGAIAVRLQTGPEGTSTGRVVHWFMSGL